MIWWNIEEKGFDPYLQFGSSFILCTYQMLIVGSNLQNIYPNIRASVGDKQMLAKWCISVFQLAFIILLINNVFKVLYGQGTGFSWVGDKTYKINYRCTENLTTLSRHNLYYFHVQQTVDSWKGQLQCFSSWHSLYSSIDSISEYFVIVRKDEMWRMLSWNISLEKASG